MEEPKTKTKMEMKMENRILKYNIMHEITNEISRKK